ncbi:MAG: hypothetical protein KGH88_09315, partial [Thaumarchaeota archaeon]|nr:hypothetical protein [Nitrososphaerota archaeon]
AVFTVTPQINVNPIGGPAGQIVTVTGFDFAPSSTVMLTFNGTTRTTSPSTITTDSSGSFTATFTVPGITAGSYLVVAEDSQHNVGASVFTVILTVSLTPATGHVGDQTTVGGSGFNPSSSMTLTYNGVPVGTSTTNSTGSFTATITIPPSGIGSQHLVVSDASCNTVNSLININPSLTLNPGTGPSSRTVTVIGSGFARSSAVTLTYDGTALATSPSVITTDSSGSFTATFSVPSSASGSHNIVATDSQSDNMSVVYYIDNLSALISLKPGNTSPGGIITVNGTSFASSSQAILKFNSTALATSPGTITTDSSGSFTATSSIPYVPAGQYKINATNNSGTVLSTAIFTAGPSLSLNPVILSL